MKITVKRSIWPWGAPDIEVDLGDSPEYIKIYGCLNKKVKTGVVEFSKSNLNWFPYKKEDDK